MDTILKVIDGVTTDRLVKSIINSLNENQEKSKDWLIEKSIEYFSFFNSPSIVIAAGWYGHLANKLKEYTKGEIVSFLGESGVGKSTFLKCISGLEQM